MALTSGVHHLATLTADMDRLIAFYTEIFEAEVTEDFHEEGLRHAFIDVGGGFVLHPFEAPFLDVPQGEIEIFKRGRIDHLALRAPSADVFWELRERIHRAGASDIEGTVTDLGPLLSAGFVDPDGVWGEVIWERPPETARGKGLREDWAYVPYPERVN